LKILNTKDGYNLFASYYHQQYEHLDSFDWEISKEVLFKNIDDLFLKNKYEIKIADFGCGDGRILKRVAKFLENKAYSRYKIFGYDISEEMIKIAKRKINKDIIFNVVNLEKEKITEKFDLIYSFFLLVHINDIDNFFQNASICLDNDGFFIFNNIKQKKGFQLPFIKEETYIKFFNHTDSKVLNTIEKYFCLNEKVETDFSTIFVCKNLNF